MLIGIAKEFLKGCYVEDRGILQFLFPEYDIYEENIPPFLNNKKIILISSAFKSREGCDIINIQKFSTKCLNDRKIFQEFLVFCGYKISNDNVEYLKFLTSEECLGFLKVFYFLRKFPKRLPKKGSVFNLFKNLFGSFSNSVEAYYELTENYKVVVTSLITMMSKTYDVDFVVGKNSEYSKLLRKNSMHVEIFKKSIVCYLETSKTEIDFLSFLYALSHEGRLDG